MMEPPFPEVPATKAPGVRLTIRGLMVVIAIVAGLFALPDWLQATVVLLSLPCLVLFAAWQLFLWGRLRATAISFWSLAIAVNVVFAALCTIPGSLTSLFFVAWLFILLPMIAGFGTTWAILTARDGMARRLSRPVAWLLVIVLAVMPGVTAWTAWPLRLVFLAARPAMERLANQVAAGQAVTFPQWVGPFQVVGSKFDPGTGGVALLTDRNPGGPSGFVRFRGSASVTSNCHYTIRGDWFHVGLADEWCYHEED